MFEQLARRLRVQAMDERKVLAEAAACAERITERWKARLGTA